jgi:hypothetical protein
LLRDDFLKIQATIEELKEQQRMLVEKTISECSHPIEHIREWIGHDRPWLICAACGLTEEGWGCGYKKLKHAAYQDVPQIRDEMWFSMRTRSVFQSGRVV